MEKITLKALLHRNAECIGICFAKNSLLEKIVRKQPAVKWSQTNTCWYIPLQETAFYLLVKDLKDKAIIDHTGLKAYLIKKKNIQSALPEKTTAATTNKPVFLKPVSKTAAWQLSSQNIKALQNFIEILKLKSYSESTIKTYTNEFLQLLQLLKNKPADDLTVADLKRYMVFAVEKQGISENTAHSRLNALKFYFEQVLRREKFFWEIPRPKKPIQLPQVFNQDEIAAIINSLQNKKHKVMLMLAYSAGLRVSEVVALRTYHIDSKRMIILIKQAKGKKDRIVSLSPVLLVMLREYAVDYKPDKKGYLFEGSTKGTAYSTRSLQEVLQAAKTKAGVIKPGSIHSLRHSFATHLIDKGTDVTMIQKLLGHNDIKTTLRYLHTSNKDLLKIISPLDDLKLN